MSGDKLLRRHAAWLALPAQLFLTDNEPERPPVAIEMQIGEEITTIETEDGHVRARPGPAENPELVLSGQSLIGFAFDQHGGLVVCSNDTAYRLTREPRLLYAVSRQ